MQYTEIQLLHCSYQINPFNLALMEYWQAEQMGQLQVILLYRIPIAPIQMQNYSGAQAFHQIVARSSLGSTYVPYGSKDVSKELSDNLQGGSGSSASNNSQNHEDSSNFTFDPTNGGQSAVRVYTLKEDLSQEELSVFDDKIKELQSKNIISNEKIPYQTNVFKKLNQGITLKATSAAGDKGIEIDSSFQLERANNKHVYPCANLIEFLLAINTKIKLTGGFNLAREMMEGNGKVETGNRLNDHSSGRGIDCFHIGMLDSSLINLGLKNLENNKNALTILLEAMNALDQSLLPDLVVFDDRLANEFGIVSGKGEFTSGANGIIQNKYKNLKKKVQLQTNITF